MKFLVLLIVIVIQYVIHEIHNALYEKKKKDKGE